MFEKKLYAVLLMLSLNFTTLTVEAIQGTDQQDKPVVPEFKLGDNAFRKYIKALVDRSLDEIERMVNSGEIYYGMTDAEGYSVLDYAVLYNFAEAVELFLELGVDPETSINAISEKTSARILLALQQYNCFLNEKSSGSVARKMVQEGLAFDEADFLFDQIVYYLPIYAKFKEKMQSFGQNPEGEQVNQMMISGNEYYDLKADLKFFRQLLNALVNAYNKNRMGTNIKTTNVEVSKSIEAVRKGNITFLKQAIERGIDVNLKDELGNTLLREAIKRGDKDAVKILILANANVNKDDIEAAAARGNLDLISCLLATGSQITMNEQSFLNLEELAKKQESESIYANIDFLRLYFNMPDPKPMVNTIIELVRAGNSKDLLEAFSELRSKDIESIKARSWLINEAINYNCNVHVLESLMKFGCLPTYNDESLGGLPLHIACDKNRVEIVRLLLANCQNSKEETTKILPMVLNNNGETALHIACRKNKIEIVKLLLEYFESGGDMLKKSPNILNRDDETPLHVAIASRCSEIVQLLIDYPYINLSACGKITPTVIYYAIKNNDINVVKILIGKGVTIWPAHLNLAIENKNFEIFKLLLKNIKLSSDQLSEVYKFLKKISKEKRYKRSLAREFTAAIKDAELKEQSTGDSSLQGRDKRSIFNKRIKLK